MRTYDVNKPAKRKKKPSRVPRRWVPYDQRKRFSKSWFAKTLIKHLKLYCKYSKLAGFKYFVEPEASWFDRVLWTSLYAIIVPTMIYTIYHGYLDFVENPCSVSVDTEYFPTQNLTFPGVAVCSINRISREAVLEMANEIFERNITRLTVEEILEIFLQLGEFYESQYRIPTRTYRIDQLLLQFYNGYYDITEVLKRVTPQCSALLSRCRFHNEKKNCSEEFEFRKTQDGFCCTFNYAVKMNDTVLNDDVDRKLDPTKVENFGEENGLLMLLEPLLNDYFFPIFPITGWKVTIFNPHDYPDMTSGGVIEIFVPTETQMNVELQGIVSYGTKNIRRYSLKHRHCVFPEEMISAHASYTYSDCIVDCRVQDIWEICRCVPFYMPNRKSKRVCNLEDVPCLLLHKSKWYSATPYANLHNLGVANSTETLVCNNCYPVCSDVTYKAKISESHLGPGRHKTKLLDGVPFANQSTVHVYFSRPATIKLKQDVVNHWYELLSEASGIGGIFIGFSLMAIVEFGYFVGLFVSELLKGPTSTSDGIEGENKRKRPALRTIYRDELYPKTEPAAVANWRDRIRDKY